MSKSKINLTDEDKNKILNVGVDPEANERSGSYILVDDKERNSLFIL